MEGGREREREKKRLQKRTIKKSKLLLPPGASTHRGREFSGHALPQFVAVCSSATGVPGQPIMTRCKHENNSNQPPRPTDTTPLSPGDQRPLQGYRPRDLTCICARSVSNGCVSALEPTPAMPAATSARVGLSFRSSGSTWPWAAASDRGSEVPSAMVARGQDFGGLFFFRSSSSPRPPPRTCAHDGVSCNKRHFEGGFLGWLCFHCQVF